MWKRFDRWCERGVWEALAEQLDEPDLIELQLDSTSIKVPIAAVGGRRQADEEKRTPTTAAASVGPAEA